MNSRAPSAWRDSLGDTVRFGAILLLAAMAMFGVMSILGCGCCGCGGSTQTSTSTVESSSFRAAMTSGHGGELIRPGQVDTRVLGATGGQGGPVTYVWTPPEGASGFAFDIPPEPGGPPFVWRDQPADQAITVSFSYALAAPPAGGYVAVDTLSVTADGRESVASTVARVASEGDAQAARSAALAQLRPPAEPAALVQMWHIEQWLDPEFAMTTDLCDQLGGEAGRETAFVALRLPVAQESLTRSVTLPVALGAPADNKIEIFRYQPYGAVASIPVEYKPERFAFAANALPAKPGEEWVVLGAADPGGATCPKGLDLPAGTWSFLAHLWLDLSDQPNNCLGCQIPAYVCYEGQELPPFVDGLASKLALRAVGQRSYRGEGITCAGPLLLQLNNPNTWELGSVSTQHVTPTQTISLHHYLHASSWMQATLQVTSTLDVDWGLYEGSYDAPNLDRPIAGPVSFGTKDVWAVSGPVPEGADPGAYTITVRATKSGSTDERVATDLVWVGDWVAPPAGAAVVHLPLLQRP